MILAALRQRRSTAEVRAAYDEFLQRMRAARAAEGALAAGDRMPAFLLPNAEGRLVHSDELLAAGPLVVTFFRGEWCPYCSVTLDALQVILPALTEAGAGVVAMTPETGGRAQQMKQAHGLRFEVLADVDLAIGMAFGIVFRVPPLYAAMLAGRGVDLAERSGNPAWLLPVPATFLVGRDGVIARTWVTMDFTQRAEPGEVLEAVRLL